MMGVLIMADPSISRTPDAAAGAIGLALILVALFLPGAPAKTSDPVAHLSDVLLAHRGAFLVGTWIAGMGAVAIVWFLGRLHAELATGDDGAAMAPTAVAGGVIAVVLILAGMALPAGVALNAAKLSDPALVRTAVDVANVVIEMSKFGLAVLVLATCYGGRRWLDGRAVPVGVVAAAVLVASALPPFLADRGIWQFGGPVDLAGLVPGALWMGWLSLHVAHGISASGGWPKTAGAADASHDR
jgi:hypothetical protein